MVTEAVWALEVGDATVLVDSDGTCCKPPEHIAVSHRTMPEEEIGGLNLREASEHLTMRRVWVGERTVKC